MYSCIHLFIYPIIIITIIILPPVHGALCARVLVGMLQLVAKMNGYLPRPRRMVIRGREKVPFGHAGSAHPAALLVFGGP